MKSAQAVDDQTIDVFLDDFLTARIGTDILTSQYLALTGPGSTNSAIDPLCDPVRIIRTAAIDATQLCKFHFGRSPPIDVSDASQVRFPFISQYLNYIVFEVLKNSVRAVTERHSLADLDNHPVRVLVCGDESTVAIRISDDGGGIPPDAIEKVWCYLYTTAKPPSPAEDDIGSDDGHESSVAPLAGFGCGLPLSRNYASYVGGRLELSSMHQHGTNAYVYLNRLGDADEVLEPRHGLPSRGYLQ